MMIRAALLANRVGRENFDELFQQEPEGFVPRWMPDVREVLITWEPGKSD